MRAVGSDLFGIQSWVALPTRYEETEPTFAHHGANELPIIEDNGKRVRLIAGSLYGARSPVRLLSDMFYAEVILEETLVFRFQKIMKNVQPTWSKARLHLPRTARHFTRDS